MAHFRDIIENNLMDEKEAYEFVEWAFGENFRDIQRQDLPEAWNKLHGDKLIIHLDGYPEDDIPNMIRLWKLDTKKVFSMGYSINSHFGHVEMPSQILAVEIGEDYMICECITGFYKIDKDKKIQKIK